MKNSQPTKDETLKPQSPRKSVDVENPRLTRRKFNYWFWFLVVPWNILSYWVSYSVNYASPLSTPETAASLLILTIPVYIVHLFKVASRCKDIGWWPELWLLMLIPIVQLLFTILLLFWPGQLGDNKYGPDPYADKHKDRIRRKEIDERITSLSKEISDIEKLKKIEELEKKLKELKNE